VFWVLSARRGTGISKTRKSDAEKAQAQKDKEAHEQESEKIATYNRSIARAEASLQGYLSQMHTNVRLLQGCIKRIHTEGIMANLPRVIEFDAELMFSLKNQEIVNKWLKLSIRIKQINNLVDDYRAVYTRTTESVREAQLHNQELNPIIVREDYALLKGFGESVISGVEILIDDTMGMLALITYHAKFPDDKFASIVELNKYQVKLADYEIELGEIKSRFDPSNMFQDLN
jgi:hypothetical protein